MYVCLLDLSYYVWTLPNHGRRKNKVPVYKILSLPTGWMKTGIQKRHHGYALMWELLNCGVICNPHSFDCSYVGSQDIFTRPGNWKVALHQGHGTYLVRQSKKDREQENSWAMALKFLDLWKWPMVTRTYLGTPRRSVFHKGWQDWSNISDIAQYLWYLRTSVENKASLVLLFWGAILVWYCYEQGSVNKLKHRCAKSVSFMAIWLQKSRLWALWLLPRDLLELLLPLLMLGACK